MKTSLPNLDAGLANLACALAEAQHLGGALPAADWLGCLQDTETARAVHHATGVALGWWGPDVQPNLWKSGAGSRTQPLGHAALPRARLTQAPCAHHQAASRRPLRVEPELAFRLGVSVSPAQAASLDEAQAWALMDGMALSLEFLDCRWQDPGEADALLLLADGLWHGGLHLGPWLPMTGRDWAQQAGTLSIGSHPPLPFCGSHPLGSPSWLLPQWLQHLTRHGQSVAAGTVVTTGSWAGAHAVQAGETITLHFDDIGSLEVTLAGPATV